MRPGWRTTIILRIMVSESTSIFLNTLEFRASRTLHRMSSIMNGLIVHSSTCHVTRLCAQNNTESLTKHKLARFYHRHYHHYDYPTRRMTIHCIKNTEQHRLTDVDYFCHNRRSHEALISVRVTGSPPSFLQNQFFSPKNYSLRSKICVVV